jgi:hypothetical protein
MSVCGGVSVGRQWLAGTSDGLGLPATTRAHHATAIIVPGTGTECLVIVSSRMCEGGLVWGIPLVLPIQPVVVRKGALQVGHGTWFDFADHHSCFTSFSLPPSCLGVSSVLGDVSSNILVISDESARLPTCHLFQPSLGCDM